MITPEERKIFRKLIGSKHCARIQKYMEEKGIKSQLKEPFGTPFISLVFNGRRENKTIERAIWEMAEERAKEIEEKKNRLSQIVDKVQRPVVMQDDVEEETTSEEEKPKQDLEPEV